MTVRLGYLFWPSVVTAWPGLVLSRFFCHRKMFYLTILSLVHCDGWISNCKALFSIIYSIKMKFCTYKRVGLGPGSMVNLETSPLSNIVGYLAVVAFDGVSVAVEAGRDFLALLLLLLHNCPVLAVLFLAGGS
jgi:hypothetical protein